VLLSFQPCSQLALCALRLECLLKSPGKGFALNVPIGDGDILLPLPLIRKINDQPGARSNTSHRKQVVQDGALLIHVAWFAQRMPKWPMEIEHTWCLHYGRQFSNVSERDGCYPTGLNFSSEQPHGPRTNRSGGHQYNQIDVSPGEKGTNLVTWGQEILRITGKAEAVVDVSSSTHDSFRFQLKQSFEWKDQVEIT
jgi:hypothetical protein